MRRVWGELFSAKEALFRDSMFPPSMSNRMFFWTDDFEIGQCVIPFVSINMVDLFSSAIKFSP